MAERVIVCDTNPAFIEAWGEAECVELKSGSIIDIECDALVSPANSFGFMDGGVDYVYSEYLGWHVQEALQAAIRKRPMGELLVGEALLVETGHANVPYLISAPTMRVPMRISDANDIYLATKASLICARSNIPGKTIAFPGMGTGCGGVPFDLAARMMKNAIHGQPTFPSSWQEAQARHFNG